MSEIHGSGLHQGEQAELHCSRITSRVGDQTRRLDLFSIHLWKAIDGPCKKLGRRVLDLVPFLPGSHIFQAKISRKIHHPYPGRQESLRLAHRDSVGCRKKHNVTLAQVRLDWIREHKIHDAAQAWEEFRHAAAGFLTRSDGHEFGLRMLREYAQQLYSGITRPTDDANLDHRCLNLDFPTQIGIAVSEWQTKKPPWGGFPARSFEHQRLEYCLRRRALCRPTFFRSTSRASRVTSPALLSRGLSVGSYSMSARVNPCRTAPACPNSPPPDTLTTTSNCVSFSVSTSGWRTTICPVSRAKYSFAGRSFTMKSPLPALMNTRATELLRRPVP